MALIWTRFLVIADKTSREIADFYGIGLHAVEFDRANLMPPMRPS